MSTFGAMKTRIADEIARSDLSTQIGLAIKSAIADYEDERFNFNETRATMSTVAGTEFYDMPSNLIKDDSLRVNLNGNEYDMNEVSYEYIEQNQVNNSYQGFPYQYAKYQEKFRFYPIPNAVYVVTLSYMKKLAALSADDDTNAWMTDAEELIRQRAKWDLYTNLIQDFSIADRMKSAEIRAHKTLRNKSNAKTTTGRFLPNLI